MKRLVAPLALLLVLALAGGAQAVRVTGTLTADPSVAAAGDTVTLTATTNGPSPQIVGLCSLAGTAVTTYPGFGVGNLTVTFTVPEGVDECEFRLITTRDGDHFRLVAEADVYVAGITLVPELTILP